MHFHRLILSKALIQTQRKYIWKYYLNTESYIIKMTQFDDREKAEERKFATKEEAEFKANARRNKLVGLWAAQLLGLEGDKANAYASSLVVEDLKEADDQDVLNKLKSDFAAAKIDVSEHQIEREMAKSLEQARSELGA